MVFFTCNSCGSSVKKPQAEKHTFQCRGPVSFSCMDCNKDFRGDEYKNHTKCISEEEKYSGQDWKAPCGHNKGEKKQQAWVDVIKCTLDKAGKSLKPSSRSLLYSLSKHDNVPKKKKQFMNFVKNISKGWLDQQTIDDVWVLLELQWKSELSEKQSNGKSINESREATTELNVTLEDMGKPKITKNKETLATPGDEINLDIESGDMVTPKHKKNRRKKQQTAVTSEDDQKNLEVESGDKGTHKRKKNKREKEHTVVMPEVIDLEIESEEIPAPKRKKNKRKKEQALLTSGDNIINLEVKSGNMEKLKRNKRDKVQTTPEDSKQNLEVESDISMMLTHKRNKRKKQKASTTPDDSELNVELESENAELPKSKKNKRKKTQNSLSIVDNGE